MTITPLYAAFATFLYVFLSWRVISNRRDEQISLGTNDSLEMEKRIRVHGNYAEYVPFALLLMLMAEIQNAAPWNLHMIGLTLFAGRITHAYSIATTPQILNLRIAGMALTFASLIAGALTILAFALF